MTFSADAVKEISENRNGGVSAAFGKLILVLGLGGGQVVSVLTYYSKYPRSNPAKVDNTVTIACKELNKLKSPRIVHS